MHGVDVAYAAILTAAFAYIMLMTRDYFFWLDDWVLLDTAAKDFVDPYNGHLSIVILGLYRVLIKSFGFQYAPFQFMGAVCLLAVPASLYLTTRRQVGPTVAAVLGLSFFATENAPLFPGELNHYLALVGGIGCAAALNRGRRADPWLAFALSFSLASAGGGLAVAVACLTHLLCVRPSLRRWAAVLAPIFAWVCWWLILGRDYHSELAASPKLTLQLVRDLAVAAFSAVGFHITALGLVLMIAYVCYGARLVRQGLDAAANWLAWTAALLFWGVGLAYSRGVFADPHAFRYQILAIGFIVLAVVPRQPIRWPARDRREPRGLDRRGAAVALVFVVVLAAVRAPALERDVTESVQRISTFSRLNRGLVAVLAAEPELITDDQQFSFNNMGVLRAGDVRSLLQRFGYVAPVDTDRALVDMGVVRARSGRGTTRTCAPLAAPITHAGTTLAAPLVLWSPNDVVQVDVRRFGEEWMKLADAQPGEDLIVFLPGLYSEVPWQVRAIGACEVVRQ